MLIHPLYLVSVTIVADDSCGGPVSGVWTGRSQKVVGEKPAVDTVRGVVIIVVAASYWDLLVMLCGLSERLVLTSPSGGARAETKRVAHR